MPARTDNALMSVMNRPDAAPVEGWLVDAVLVLPDGAFTGAVRLEQGCIADIREAGGDRPPPAGGTSLAGLTLLPGLVDLHTDSLEGHLQPRRHVHWDPLLAVMEQDRRFLACGITTIFDCLTLGDSFSRVDQKTTVSRAVEGLEQARDAGLLSADHRLHLRLETTDPETPALYDALADHPLVGLVSLMDHAPGQRQTKNVEQFRDVYLMGSQGLTREQAEAAIHRVIEASRTWGPQAYRTLAAKALARGQRLASHDDETEAHVAMAVAAGVSISEFPTTRIAAERARAAGMQILMGAPNLWRGVSSSGNVPAGSLAQASLLDGLLSDYIPGSLLPAALRLTQAPYDWPLHQAVAMVTARPADMVGLQDRGALAVGRRADLVVLDLKAARPRIVSVLAGGQRVA